MAMKNTAEVVIGGKVYKISGYESPEYLHQVAAYINDKMVEFQKMESYRLQSTDQKQLLLNMNLADDYFKAKRKAEKLTADLEKKERELYSVRHDLIEAQLALEDLKKQLEAQESKEKEQPSEDAEEKPQVQQHPQRSKEQRSRERYQKSREQRPKEQPVLEEPDTEEQSGEKKTEAQPHIQKQFRQNRGSNNSSRKNTP